MLCALGQSVNDVPLCGSTVDCLHLYIRSACSLIEKLGPAFLLFLLILYRKQVGCFVRATARRLPALRPAGLFSTQRLLPQIGFWFFAWPLFSVLMAICASAEHPLTKETPYFRLALCAWVTCLHMVPEFLATALVACLASVLIFWAFTRSRAVNWLVCLGESALAFAAIALGIALEYPILLNHPAIRFVRAFEVFTAYGICMGLLLICALALGFSQGRGWRALLSPTAAAVLVGFGWMMTWTGTAPAKSTPGNKVVILGLDSLSQSDDLRGLRNLSREKQGTYYDHAVTPGLVTNVVWSSIVMHRPVHDTGVVFVYQPPDWNRSPYQLVRKAKEAGFETWAFFGDPFLGPQAGFDHDHSGPNGWLQIAATTLKDASILVPVFIAKLPHLLFTQMPRNHPGTFAYDLRREVREILQAGTNDRPILAMAHLEYLHETAYPRFSELRPHERDAVRKTKVTSVQDFSLHWQQPPVPGDHIEIYAWKCNFLQQVIAEELEATGFLDPAKKNRLAIFSDHGNRNDMTFRGFGRPKYYSVVLLTFGVPGRRPDLPISTIDIPVMLGFPDASAERPFEAVVEYTGSNSWPEMIAAFEYSGNVSLNQERVVRYGELLRAYRPYGENRGYYDAPVRWAGSTVRSSSSASSAGKSASTAKGNKKGG
jgi:hypothetical protein